MSDEDQRLAALDARLRGLFGTLDARAGFEGRVMARVTSLATVTDAAREDLRAQFERRREIARRRIAREDWTNGITIAGIGFAAIALVWRLAPGIRQWAHESGLAADLDPMRLAVYSSGVFLLLLMWPLLRKMTGLRNF
jgi:hypothetical protein